MEKRALVVEICCQRSGTFTASDLAHFIDMRFYELTQTIKTNNQLVRVAGSSSVDGAQSLSQTGNELILKDTNDRNLFRIS